MGRLVHFEIHVEDMDRAKKFYGEVFGWKFEDWSEYAGMPYFGAVTVMIVFWDLTVLYCNEEARHQRLDNL